MKNICVRLVFGVLFQQDKSCDECLEVCKLPRSGPGCVHLCEKRCHPMPCEPCTVAIKTACHCGLTQVYYKCDDLNKGNDEQIEQNREKLLSCGNRCIKNVILLNNSTLLLKYIRKFFNNIKNNISIYLYSFRAVIVVSTHVIRVIVRMKNFVEKNWKFIANARAAKLRQHVRKFEMVLS